MVSRFSEIVVDCHAPRGLAGFWCAVLGYQILAVDDDSVEIGPADLPVGDDFAEWRRRHREAPSPPTLVFGIVPEGKTVKNRLHIDVSPLGDHAEEVERLIALGATRADIGQGEVRWTVLRDPEGNEFCVLRSLAP